MRRWIRRERNKLLLYLFERYFLKYLTIWWRSKVSEGGHIWNFVVGINIGDDFSIKIGEKDYKTDPIKGCYIRKP